MKQNISIKNVLIGLGLISLAINLVAMFTSGSFSDGWMGLLFGASVIVIGYSIGDKTKLK